MMLGVEVLCQPGQPALQGYPAILRWSLWRANAACNIHLYTTKKKASTYFTAQQTLVTALGCRLPPSAGGDCREGVEQALGMLTHSQVSLGVLAGND